MNQKKTGMVLAYLNVFSKNLIMLIYTPILLNCLGENEFGIYQVANSVISNLSLLSMGFTLSYVKFFVQNLQRKDYLGLKKLNSTYLYFFAFISILSLAIGSFLVMNVEIFFSDTLSIGEVRLAQKLMFWMIFNVVFMLFNSIFESNIVANERFIFQQSKLLVQTLILPCITIPILLFLDLGALSIVIIQTLLSLIILILNISYCIKKLEMKFHYRLFDFSTLRKIGKFSFFIFLNQIFNQINETAPIFILGSLSSTKDVAIYAVINQLKSVFLTLAQTITNIYIPEVNHIVCKEKNNLRLIGLMTELGRLQILVLGLFLGGFIVFGKYFIYLWLGNGYENAYYLLISLVIPLIIPLCQSIGIEIQQAKNMHVFRSIVLTFFSILNIVFTFFLVKRFGLIGSTLGYIFSLIFGYGIVMNWFYNKKMKLDMKYFWRKSIPMMMPTCITTVVFLIILRVNPVNNNLTFLFLGFLFCLMYFGLIYILISILGENKIYKKMRGQK